MDRNSVNIKRFVKSIRYAMETLAGDAKCYFYQHDPEYLELKEDLKFCLRELEEGEEFAGKLLFKNARKIAPSTAEAMAARAKTEEERQFFLSLAQMNRNRTEKKIPKNSDGANLKALTLDKVRAGYHFPY